MGDPFDQPSRVDKDQGCAVGADQIGHAVQGLSPHLVGGDGSQFPFGQLHGQVDGPGVAGVDDRTVGLAVSRDEIISHQQPSDFFYGALGRGKPDAHYGILSQSAEPFDG